VTAAVPSRQSEASRTEASHVPALAADRTIAVWLMACAAMIFLMVIIGGITRLTESGLSITEWKPITGVLPPLSEAHWQAEFEKYRQIPEYKFINKGMSLDEFKSIYFWEYVHRLWGRLIGIAFAVPLLYFLARGRIGRSLAKPLLGLFGLGALQGAMGWYMVQSGLVDRTDVSQYRLTAHLGLAVLIYGVMIWIAANLWYADHPPVSVRADAQLGRMRTALAGIVALVFLTILSGGFVAGLGAGMIYNTFPLMDGRLVPDSYWQIEPWYQNFFENIAAVQFDHRVLATTSFLSIVLFWFKARSMALPVRARRATHLLLGAAGLQVALGISTLLLVVPIPLAAAHQAGAVLLFTAAVLAAHRWRAARWAPYSKSA
jgi:cytochrome c oxidase assembly protein subunit 15